MFGLETLAPRFLVPSKSIRILHNPKDFYAHLCSRIKAAKQRVFLASLYLGKSEREFIDVIASALKQNEKLQVYVLVDALRGTREAPRTCSANLLSPLAAKYPSRVRLAMYQSPKVNWLTSKLLPKRVIEGIGLQHMKLYGFDDEILLSGANLSTEYFTNRQDRYISILDSNLTNFFFNIHQQVSNLSHKLLPASNEQSFELLPPPRAEAQRAHLALQKLISPRSSTELESSAPTDVTEVYPVCQFTPLGLGTEHNALMQITNKLRELKFQWLFTAGYFNVEPKLGANLMAARNGEIILASPKANGFYNSKGASGSIPRYYSILAWKYLHRIPPSANVSFREWQRGTVNTPGGWSYHAKGLWAGQQSSTDFTPTITYIGSSNFTRRSYRHDLECGAVLVTKSQSLEQQLKAEVENLLSNCGSAQPAQSFPAPMMSSKDRLLLRMFGDRL